MTDEMPQLDLEDLNKLEKSELVQVAYAALVSNTAQQKQIADLNEAVRLLTEKVKGAEVMLFGRSSDKKMSKDTDGQLSFIVNAMNELEIVCDQNPDPVEPEVETETITPKPYTRKKSKGKRDQDLSNLPKEIVEDRLTNEELLKLFPDGKWTEMESYRYSRLEVVPATFKVVEHRVMAYKGRNGKIVKAEHAPYLFRNSIATPSIVSLVINMKFVNGMPIHRIWQEMDRNDVHISTPVLCNWVNSAAQDYFKKIRDRMIQIMKQSHVIHSDETPVKVRQNFDDDSNRIPGPDNCYMWVYRTGEFSPHPIIVYDFCLGRGTEYPDSFLKGYNNALVTDGYGVYHTLQELRRARGESLTVANCWIHAKRPFAKVVKINTEGMENSIAHKACRLIENIFHEEEKLRDLTPEERLKQRQDKIAPLVDAYFAWLKQIRPYVASKSKTGAGITYNLDQEEYLRKFLTDGEIPMTNNAAERAIRPFVLGRKNWYLVDTRSGAESTAILYSMAETAKANNVKPYEWFKYCLEQMCQRGEFEDLSYLDNLMPWSDKLPDYIRKPSQDQADPAAADQKTS